MPSPPRHSAARWSRAPRSAADLVVAQLALLGAQWTVWRSPEGSLVTASAVADAADAARRPARPPRPGAWRLAVSVRRAARYGLFRPKCLVRSLALQRLLARAGMPEARVVVGVRRVDGAFEAHAWVELDGRPLGEDAQVGRGFARLSRLQVAEGTMPARVEGR